MGNGYLYLNADSIVIGGTMALQNNFISLTKSIAGDNEMIKLRNTDMAGRSSISFYDNVNTKKATLEYINNSGNGYLYIDADSTVASGTMVVIGTITASKFIGDGSLLTGISNSDTDWAVSGINISRNSGKVGIGTDTPHSTLHNNGSFAAGGLVSTSSISYSAGDTDYIIVCDPTSDTITVNLPDAASITGRIYKIKHIGTLNAVTIDPYSTQTIDGNPTYTLASQWKYVEIISNGLNWLITGNN